MSQISRPATATEIIEVVGPSRRFRADADRRRRPRVLEAFTWANADDQIGTELEHRPRGAAARVCEILKREESEPDER